MIEKIDGINRDYSVTGYIMRKLDEVIDVVNKLNENSNSSKGPRSEHTRIVSKLSEEKEAKEKALDQLKEARRLLMGSYAIFVNNGFGKKFSDEIWGFLHDDTV